MNIFLAVNSLCQQLVKALVRVHKNFRSDESSSVQKSNNQCRLTSFTVQCIIFVYSTIGIL